MTEEQEKMAIIFLTISFLQPATKMNYATSMEAGLMYCVSKVTPEGTFSASFLLFVLELVLCSAKKLSFLTFLFVCLFFHISYQISLPLPTFLI